MTTVGSIDRTSPADTCELTRANRALTRTLATVLSGFDRFDGWQVVCLSNRYGAGAWVQVTRPGEDGQQQVASVTCTDPYTAVMASPTRGRVSVQVAVPFALAATVAASMAAFLAEETAAGDPRLASEQVRREEVTRLVQTCVDRLGADTVATLAGVDAATVTVWAAGIGAEPSFGQRSRLRAAQVAWDAVASTRDEDSARAWFSAPDPALGTSPARVLSLGRTSEVVDAARTLTHAPASAAR